MPFFVRVGFVMYNLVFFFCLRCFLCDMGYEHINEHVYDWGCALNLNSTDTFGALKVMCMVHIWNEI